VIGLREQVICHGTIRSSTLALEESVKYNSDVYYHRTPREKGELWDKDGSPLPPAWDGSYVPPIPVDIKPPPEPMWREGILEEAKAKLPPPPPPEPKPLPKIVRRARRSPPAFVKDPWKTPTVWETTPKRDIKLREIAEMTDPEFLEYLWITGHQIAWAEYKDRIK